MKIPGRTRIVQEEPQQPIEHERLEEISGSRRGARTIGCGVIVLAVFIGSPFMWSKIKQDYSIRAGVSQGFNLTYSVRSAIEEHFKDHGELPANNEEAGLPPPHEISDNYVSQVGVAEGEIVVVYGNKAHEKIAGKKLTLVPDESRSPELSWTCSSLEIPDKWLTASCRTTR